MTLGYRLYLFLGILGLLLLGAWVQPSTASGSIPMNVIPMASVPRDGHGFARWAVEVVFVNKAPVGQMNIEIIYLDNSGAQAAYYGESYDITCIEQGNLTYSMPNTAYFDGNGSYILCDLYDMEATVAAITGGALQMAPSSQQAEIITKVDASPVYNAKTDNPIFYTDAGFSYSLPNTSVKNQAQMRLDFDLTGQHVVSEEFPLSGMDTHAAEVFDAKLSSELTRFENSSLFQKTATPVDMQLLSNTSNLTIGANLQTGEYFEGEMRALFIDPRVFVRCC